MPRFFFSISSDLIRDEDGSELSDLAEVSAEATEHARHLLSEALRRGQVIDERRFEVTDESGATVLILPLRNAMKLS